VSGYARVVSNSICFQRQDLQLVHETKKHGFKTLFYLLCLDALDFWKIRKLFGDKTFCVSMTSCPAPSKIRSNFFHIISTKSSPLVCIDVFKKLVLKLYFGFEFRSRSVWLLCLVWFSVVGCCCCRCCVVWFGVVCSLYGVVWWCLMRSSMIWSGWYGMVWFEYGFAVWGCV
jgi:hypothetical protein